MKGGFAMKHIATFMVVVCVSLTSVMGQSAKRARQSNKEPTSRGEVCSIFIVDRKETRWTDLGLVSTVEGYVVKKKGCVEPKTPSAMKTPLRTQRF